MQFYLISPLFFVAMGLCAMGGMHRLLMFLCAMMPFGMLAVVGLPAVGGLSLLAVNLSAAALVAGGVLILLSRLMRGQAIAIAPATFALLAFALYAVFSATVLVRLFAGETMVFALSRGAVGVKVSTQFSWGKVWLGPSSSNISQTFYVLLACGFFIVASQILCRRGAAFGARCFALAAGVNLALGLLDLAALDPLLSVVRTASYSLANEASVRGIPRVIGGFSEAASFGSASAMFCGYFASAWTGSRRLRDGVLALGNGAFAMLALSSTGIVALAVVVMVLTPRLILGMPQRIAPRHVLAGALALAAGALAVAAVLTLTDAPAMISSVIDDLILDKSGSSSGIERTAWAMGGLEALRDTWGLGAGTGSLRSNGLPFVLLGSVGIIGTACFVVFLWLAFGGRAAPGQAATLAAARVGALAVIVSMLLAATVPDPGVPLIFLAALAIAARQPQPVAPALPLMPAAQTR
ncbi:hypothetical protein [Oceaniglobus trochenteri]|uniref:hypothetical protein n=1 Tax=Oceaniglobus trochenteri TaxID=2763260 RepID=UPI001CFF688E|nr:hypothetical protein [Oceaniglobus trochenteri]